MLGNRLEPKARAIFWTRHKFVNCFAKSDMHYGSCRNSHILVRHARNPGRLLNTDWHQRTRQIHTYDQNAFVAHFCVWRSTHLWHSRVLIAHNGTNSEVRREFARWCPWFVPDVISKLTRLTNFEKDWRMSEGIASKNASRNSTVAIYGRHVGRMQS